MFLTSQTKNRVPYLIGAIIIIYIMKPSMLFKPNGKPRLYGIGYDDEGYKRTLYTMQFAIIVIVALLCVRIN